MERILMGLRWSDAAVPRERVAAQVCEFLGFAAGLDPQFKLWFNKASRKLDPVSAIDVTPKIVMGILKETKDDFRRVMPELGYRLSLWDRKHAVLIARLGCAMPDLGNVLVLDTVLNENEIDSLILPIFRKGIDIFNPEQGMIRAKPPLGSLDELWGDGLWRYIRGRSIFPGGEAA